MENTTLDETTDTLAAMYELSFGGKASGRYRISRKIITGLLGKRRIYAEDVQLLSRALLEKGYVLIDMESFFVVLSANSFVNYRRANEDCIPVPASEPRIKK
jgi:hypothetical protein